ncbi:MAG: hypothetical protein JNM41_08735 [Flavipsychrobacter sp.]|nr:hypothetical protein [Flavipsychrobacter sp.]
MIQRLMLLFMLVLTCTTMEASGQVPDTTYDKKLADSMGADEYGMKMYVLVLLKTGPNTVTDNVVRDSLFAGHMRNIGRLADAGKLVVAGPLKKNEKEYRGIFILNATGIAEANKLLDTDAAIRAKLLEAELYEWYGSAALPMYLPFYKKLEKRKM